MIHFQCSQQHCLPGTTFLHAMTMTMIQCLGLSLRGHGPHASYEPTGQCLFKTNGLKDKLRRLGCRCATQLLAADALYMTKALGSSCRSHPMSEAHDMPRENSAQHRVPKVTRNGEKVLPRKPQMVPKRRGPPSA